jgi:3'(2'),5'-bisphosphate nucleotidase
LTEADLRADRVIRAGLEQQFPEVFILSEESVAAGKQDAGRFFLVDPVDGTKEFLKRNGEFTVNIALIENGEPVAGVVLAPALDELFYAARGLGAYKRDSTGTRPINTLKTKPSDLLRVMGSRSHGADKLNASLATLKNTHTFVAAGSSLKFCRIAEGQADIYPRFGPTSQWDTAAAQAVLEVAGGAVTDLQGAPLRYGLDRPVLNPEFVAVGNPALLQLL